MAISKYCAVLLSVAMLAAVVQPAIARGFKPQIVVPNSYLEEQKRVAAEAKAAARAAERAAARAAARAARGVGAGNARPDDPMHNIRKRLVAKEDVAYKELQALADSGDGLGAYFLAIRIEEMGKPELLNSAAHYYSMAVQTGRDGAVRPLVKLLDAHGTGFKPATIKGAQAALEKQAASDNEIALDTLARYYSQGTIFPKDDERAQNLLGQAAERGNAKAALDIAYDLLSGTPDDTERTNALRYLEIVTRSDNLGQRAIAENLIRSLQSPATPTATVSEISP